MFWHGNRKFLYTYNQPLNVNYQASLVLKTENVPLMFCFYVIFSVNLTEKHFIYLFTFQVFLFYFIFPINLTATVLLYYFAVAVVNSRLEAPTQGARITPSQG